MSFLEYVDDLIETSLQNILGPLSQFSHLLVEPEEEFEGEKPNITLEQLMGETKTIGKLYLTGGTKVL
jgi:hypothetical protein